MAKKEKDVAKKKSPAKSKPTKTKTVAKKKTSSKKTNAPTPKKAVRRSGKNKKRKPETLMCFLTTACVRYYGLADDGYELNTLRRYRDSYLASSEAGMNLIKEYYTISPGIVSQIEKDRNKKSVYAYIYSEVNSSCAAIEKNKLKLAERIYTRMVKRLQEKYLDS